MVRGGENTMTELDFSKRYINRNPDVTFAGLKDCIIYMRKSQVEELANYCFVDSKKQCYVYPLQNILKMRNITLKPIEKDKSE